MIDVVMCQNILNFIMDLISLLVMKKFDPDGLIFYNLNHTKMDPTA